MECECVYLTRTGSRENGRRGTVELLRTNLLRIFTIKEKKKRGVAGGKLEASLLFKIITREKLQHLYEDDSYPGSNSEENLIIQDTKVRSLRRQKGTELLSKQRTEVLTGSSVVPKIPASWCSCPCMIPPLLSVGGTYDMLLNRNSKDMQRISQM